MRLLERKLFRKCYLETHSLTASALLTLNALCTSNSPTRAFILLLPETLFCIGTRVKEHILHVDALP